MQAVLNVYILYIYAGVHDVSVQVKIRRSAHVQYNYNAAAIQEFFSHRPTAVVLRLCGLLQYSKMAACSDAAVKFFRTVAHVERHRSLLCYCS